MEGADWKEKGDAEWMGGEQKRTEREGCRAEESGRWNTLESACVPARMADRRIVT